MRDRIYNTAKLQAALDVLERNKIDTDHVLVGTGLNAKHLEDVDLRVSSGQVIQAFRNISNEAWYPHIAYEIGHNLHISSYGLYGYAVLCSVTYRDTVEFAQKYHYLATPTSDMEFVHSADVSAWELEPSSDTKVSDNFYSFLVCMQMGIYNSLHKDVMGAGFTSPLIQLKTGQEDTNTLPPDAAERIEYGSACNRFHVEPEIFNTKLELGNHLTFKQVTQICETELSELTQQDGIAGIVKKTIIENAAFSETMDTVSDRLGLTSRTLRRHLKREKTTFSEIVDSARTELALKYLRQADLSTEEIAYVLGFSEAASFVRAFRRWTGGTPKSYRLPQ